MQSIKIYKIKKHSNLKKIISYKHIDKNIFEINNSFTVNAIIYFYFPLLTLN